MRKILVILLLAVISLLFTACDKKENRVKLTGAFGIKFGEVIQITDKTESIFRLNRKMYQINPPKKMDLFDNYYVAITPITHKVYFIYATKFNERGSKCFDDLFLVDSLIEKKHGKTREIEPYDVANIIMRSGGFKADGGFINYSCIHSDKAQNTIYYYSNDFGKLEKEETISQIKNKDSL